MPLMAAALGAAAFGAGPGEDGPFGARRPGAELADALPAGVGGAGPELLFDLEEAGVNVSRCSVTLRR